MKALLQRVSHASVSVADKEIAQIGRGLLVFLGVEQNDEENDADWLANKVSAIRIFPSSNKEMDHSLSDVSGSALVVSQFTLAADTRKGNRPSFSHAADPADARMLYERFVKMLREKISDVETGEFGANMQVNLVNDGPVTIPLQSP